MNSKQIEAIFTAKVTEYIQNGYTINTATMSGSQGEIAKVDVRKGDEIIRILLTQESGYGTFDEVTILTVGRNTKPIRKSGPFDTMCSTIWNSRLEIIEERRFYSANRSADYFTEDLEEAKAMHDRMMEHYRRNDYYARTADITSKAAQLAVNYIKRKTGKTRVSAKDVTVTRKYTEKGSLYYIRYFSKEFKLA